MCFFCTSLSAKDHTKMFWTQTIREWSNSSWRSTISTRIRSGWTVAISLVAIRFYKHILPQSLDTCEGARFSCYIDSGLTMLPCSFDQGRLYAVKLRPLTIEEGWNSIPFDHFREKLKNACPECANQDLCKGECPLCRKSSLPSVGKKNIPGGLTDEV